MANKVHVLTTFRKRKADVQDYDIDFTDYLNDLQDTPQGAAEVTPDAGITVVQTTMAGGVVKVWLSGGEVNTQYNVSIKLSTTGGRVREAVFAIWVIE